MILGWLKPKEGEIESIYYFLVEEELRRCQEREFSSYATYEEIDILTKTPEKQQEIIDKYVEKYNLLFTENCLVLALVKELIMKFKGNLEDPDFKDMKPNVNLMNELKFTDKAQLLAFYFQNQLHHLNATRQKAIESKSWVDCRKNWKEVFTKFEDDIGIANFKRQEKLENLNKISKDLDVSKLRKHFRNVEVLAMLNLFDESKDLDEAEELLVKSLAIKPGRVLDYYLTITKNPEATPLIYEKLLLFKAKHPKFQKIPKKFTYSLCYSKALTYDQMLDLFGEGNLPRLA